MPSWSDIAQIITALAAVGTLIQAWRNGRVIKEVQHATNSMKDELVTAVRSAAHAEGVKDEKVAAADRSSNLSQKV